MDFVNRCSKNICSGNTFIKFLWEKERENKIFDIFLIFYRKVVSKLFYNNLLTNVLKVHVKQSLIMSGFSTYCHFPHLYN